VHLSSLRRKLPEGFIRNVRGLGWMIAPRKASA
jgi:DNA-binding response OmpR family regulator